jgi:hypothetical protein
VWIGVWCSPIHAFKLCYCRADALAFIPNYRCNLKVLRKKSCVDEWAQKNIEHQKFTQLPHQISNGHPHTYIHTCTCTHYHIYPRGPILYISFVLVASPNSGIATWGGGGESPPLSSRTTFEICLNPLRNWGGGVTLIRFHVQLIIHLL